MPGIQIFMGSSDEPSLDKRITHYAESILYSDDPGQVTGLIKEKNTAKRSRHVYKLNIDEKCFFFKLYSNYSRLKGLQDLFRGQRAKRALDISVALNSIGLKTAEPVAAFELEGLSCQKRSIFVTEAVRGKPVQKVFTEESSEAQRLQVFQYLGHLYQKLINHNIYHYDLNLTNCWLEGDEFVLLDVDDVRQLRRFGLVRLYLNILKHNRILMRHKRRYPDSWISDNNRCSIIRELATRYINPMILNKFLDRVERVSARYELN